MGNKLNDKRAFFKFCFFKVFVYGVKENLVKIGRMLGNEYEDFAM